MEVWLSLDDGRTFPIWISPWMDPKAQYFYWTLPNTPTNAAVMDIRFGSEPGYPESYAPHPASTFVMAKAVPARRHCKSPGVALRRTPPAAQALL